MVGIRTLSLQTSLNQETVTFTAFLQRWGGLRQQCSNCLPANSTYWALLSGWWALLSGLGRDGQEPAGVDHHQHCRRGGAHGRH